MSTEKKNEDSNANISFQIIRENSFRREEKLKKGKNITENEVVIL